MTDETSPDMPVMIYDWNDGTIREVAENIWHAQSAGYADELTYLYRNRAGKRKIRNENMKGIPGDSLPVNHPNKTSLDEYLFASTLQNEGSVWIGKAKISHQNAQRDLMNKFYRENNAYLKGTTLRFKVKVVNHPLGEVKKVKL